MKFTDIFRREKREMQVTQSDPRLAEILGLNALAETGEAVTIASALRVPAFASGVNFLSGTIAGLPLHVYRKTKDGRKKVDNNLSRALHHAPNDGQSSFEWRKYKMDCVFTGGRGLTYIERDGAGKPINLFPLDPNKTTIKRENGRKRFEYREKGQRTKIYEADEVIDLPYMLKMDGLEHYGPVNIGRDALGLALALTKYGSKMFRNGGVPPFVIQGGFQSGAAMKRASDDLQQAIKKSAKENRQALALPAGLEIKTLGADPEKMQMIEAQRFCIEQIARLLGLPPVFLQDLTHGTFSNTEQQDLHFVKHTLKRWIEQFEQELNLKLFGRNSSYYVEFSMDGVLRGDFKTRIEAYAKGIQNSIYKPAEVRSWENLPNAGDDADNLFIQGATVPIEMAGQLGSAPSNSGEEE